MMNPDRLEPVHCVRVWFGQHVVASYTASASLADRYAASMQRRFAGLRVTTDPVAATDPTPPKARSVPPESNAICPDVGVEVTRQPPTP
ncbi:hypothetical protein AB0E69_17070 [Kribbella sp. NPDC026611]|uniref:hypothetical protein n=1 Tax=Kribbella sp. NPDC026611 TaxID=3154911 RepID=UPI0033C28C0E